MRRTLSENQIHVDAAKAINEFHPLCVQQIEDAIKSKDWVIVGMRQNPVVIGARKYLTQKNISFHYIEHGNYFSKWKERLAIKLWSGWPTFPQVFHKGILIGGLKDLKKYKS